MDRRTFLKQASLTALLPLSESNFFEEDWQHSYWGSNYARLAELKKKYDPTYPQPGIAACEILEESQDAERRSLVRITIAKPWSLESTDGETQFVVLDTQVTDKLAESG